MVEWKTIRRFNASVLNLYAQTHIENSVLMFSVYGMKRLTNVYECRLNEQIDNCVVKYDVEVSYQ